LQNEATRQVYPLGSWPPLGRTPTTYQLVIRLRRAIRVRVGALGTLRLPKGRYIYTGSAKRNLGSRIARHLVRAKRLHWHIDYLLARAESRVLEVRTFRAPECAVNRGTAGAIVAPGFGASDCRAGCGAHLKFLGPASDLE
jgi:Uri superfamily endonuclease